MQDETYVRGRLPSELESVFSQLKTELSEYEIWVRRENFGRTVLAAVVNKRRGIAVTIPVSRPGHIRSRELEAIELGHIRSHLEIGAEDLALL